MDNRNYAERRKIKIPRTAIFDDRQVVKDIAEMQYQDNNDSLDKDFSGETGMMQGKVSTNKLRKYIVSTILQPAYVQDVKDMLMGRYRWRKFGMILFIFSLIFTHSATIATFAAAHYKSPVMAFIAGAIGVVGGILLHLSLIAKGESKRATSQANEVLKNLKIDGVIDIEGIKTDSQKLDNDVNKINNDLRNNVINEVDYDNEYYKQAPNIENDVKIDINDK